MRNSIGKSPFHACYDLKGCADDKLIEKEGERIKAVHKRIWNVGMWCGQINWTDERKRYYAGKLEARGIEVELRPHQRSHFISLLKRDTDLLAGHNLMDYSLLVATKETPSGLEAPGPAELTPYRCPGKNGKDLLVYVSLIDFLQVWTNGKRVARCVKVCECNKATIPPKEYASRMLTHFTRQVVDGQGNDADSVDIDFSMENLPSEKLISRPLSMRYGNSLRRFSQ
ncbi:MSS4 [Symbiodinium natans]|uniref:MSS4 protein n=1 Tax=Symbiodinium natans TaxID=878477 RepID=A0A812TDE5_9DINO|nr:MSS4 [Symbiodinium natans]